MHLPSPDRSLVPPRPPQPPESPQRASRNNCLGSRAGAMYLIRNKHASTYFFKGPLGPCTTAPVLGLQYHCTMVPWYMVPWCHGNRSLVAKHKRSLVLQHKRSLALQHKTSLVLQHNTCLVLQTQEISCVATQDIFCAATQESSCAGDLVLQTRALLCCNTRDLLCCNTRHVRTQFWLIFQSILARSPQPQCRLPEPQISKLKFLS